MTVYSILRLFAHTSYEHYERLTLFFYNHRGRCALSPAAHRRRVTAAAAAAADAADAAASGEDFALAAETRRGAASAATSAFVNTSRPEATARVEATAEGVSDLAYALARIERSTENGNHPTENDAAIGRRVWCAAAAAAEPAVASPPTSKPPLPRRREPSTPRRASSPAAVPMRLCTSCWDSMPSRAAPPSRGGGFVLAHAWR